jgi:FliI/YscN family ATPase
MSAPPVEAVLEAAASADVHRRTGTAVRAHGELIVARGINFRPRELALVEDAGGRPIAAEYTGSVNGEVFLSALDRGAVTAGARVFATGALPFAPSGRAALGRVIDGLGRPLDGGAEIHGAHWVPVYAEPPEPLARQSIAVALATGVRAIDGFLTAGRGQRIGIFAGSGVGKSTLMGMLARGTDAHVNVIALVGERGREVRDFIEHDLGVEALRRSVIVASTGDNPASMRICAANAATAIAEGFRAEGLDVLLLFDSLTRVAMAQREIGLAAGEPPATRGYPPSVFSMLPHLMERTGPGPRGTITAFYTILVEGDDMDDPVAGISRATLDGHIVLDRALASSGHYPPIDVLASVSRLMSRVAERPHQDAARALRGLLAAYADARDLINIGAYVRGSDPSVDAAIDLLPAIEGFLRQDADDIADFEETVARMVRLAGIEAEPSRAQDGEAHDETANEFEALAGNAHEGAVDAEFVEADPE